MKQENLDELIYELGKQMALDDPKGLAELLGWNLSDIERSRRIYKYVGELALVAHTKTDSLSESESRALRLAVNVVLAFAEGATPAEAFAAENKEGGQPRKDSRQAFAKWTARMIDEGLGYNESVDYVTDVTGTNFRNVRKALDQHRNKN